MVRFVKFSFNPLTRNEVRFQSGIKSKPANPFPKIAQRGKKGAIARTVFWTHEASTYLVRHNGKRLFLRVPNAERDLGESIHSFVDTKHHALRDFTLMKMFNLLFPNNSIKPTGVAETNFGGTKAFGVLSEVVTGRSREYKTHHSNAYKNDEVPIDEHTRFVQSQPVGAFLGKVKDAGFSFEDTSWNIMNAKGNPIIVELQNVNPNALRFYLRKIQRDPSVPKSMRSPQFKQRIEILLKQLTGYQRTANAQIQEKRRFL